MSDTLVINSKDQLEKYLRKYNCKTVDELDELLWYNYGVTLQVNIKKYKYGS